MKTHFIDYREELDSDGKQIERAAHRMVEVISEQNEESIELNKLKMEIIELCGNIGESNLMKGSEPHLIALDDYDELFWQYNSETFEKEISKEVNKRPTIPLSGLDYGVIGVAGLVATLVDFFLVKVPKDMSVSGLYSGQKGSELTKLFRGIGINKDENLKPFLKHLEDKCRVPFDASINPDIRGFGTRTHRLLSLGHDPLFGLIFGVMDILNGKMTVIDAMGKVSILEGTFKLDNTDKIFAPLLWLGHIVSDICTSMGLPIPGWGFTQLLQFGSMGKKDRTVAEISRWMYMNGYDLRHFVTMTTSTACIEMIVRAYHFITSIKTEDELKLELVCSFATKDVKRIQSNLRLHKMLFLSHSVATAGNVVKVFTQQGNPLAINLPQWLAFLKESVVITQGATRNTTGEKIMRNRDSIDKNWNEIQGIKIGECNQVIADG